MTDTAATWVVLPIAALVGCGAVLAALLDATLAPAKASGPVRVLAAETARLLRQRDRAVVGSDRLLRTVGCALPLTAALLMAPVVPFGGAPAFDQRLGLVWFNTVDVLLWAAWWLIGWGSNSTFGLVGGYRFLAQALAYELPLMFALTSAAVAAGSLSSGAIVGVQQDGWFILQLPIAFVVFLGASAGFATWPPFDHPSGRDAAGGLEAEVAGAEALVLRIGRYSLLAVSAAMGAALFLGGPDGPGLPGWGWSTVKSLILLTALVALRRLPSVPAERAMRAAWVVVLPLTLVQTLVAALIAFGRA